MVDTTQIIRPATEEERKDFIELGDSGPLRPEHRKVFRFKAVEYQQKYTKLHKPYCFRCAMLDYDEEVKKVKEDMKNYTLTKADKLEGMRTERIKVDLNKYGKEDRFERVKEPEEITEYKWMGGKERLHVVTGHYHMFKCKVRGCPHSVEVPLPREVEGKRGTG